MTVTPLHSFSFWLLAGLSHSGLCMNVYISEDLCRNPEVGSPNPMGSVEHWLRTTALGYLPTSRRATKPFTPYSRFASNFFSLPVPTATPERTFSVMKILKTYLCSRSTEET